jgi:nitrogen fixation/metabolism regulation signal transduction histidine kinase
MEVMVRSCQLLVVTQISGKNDNHQQHTTNHKPQTTNEKRSSVLIHFVDAYRDYTNIPQPQFQIFGISQVFDNIAILLKEDLASNGLSLKCEVYPPDLQINADPELIQMILINLVKNAKEAMAKAENRTIILCGIKFVYSEFVWNCKHFIRQDG